MAGAGRGGGYEWRADGQPVAVGAAAVELSQDGKITKFTVVWDGSLLDDRAITALGAAAVDKLPSALNRTAPGQVALAAACQNLFARTGEGLVLADAPEPLAPHIGRGRP